MSEPKTAYQRRKERKIARATCLVYRAIVAMIEHEMLCDDYIGKYQYADEDYDLATQLLNQLVRDFKLKALREDESPDQIVW